VSVSSWRSAGREFHIDGPATEKARSTNLVLILRTTYLALLQNLVPLIRLNVQGERKYECNIDQGRADAACALTVWQHFSP